MRFVTRTVEMVFESWQRNGDGAEGGSGFGLASPNEFGRRSRGIKESRVHLIKFPSARVPREIATATYHRAASSSRLFYSRQRRPPPSLSRARETESRTESEQD